MPPEILRKITSYMDLCTATCFGLTCRDTYMALKAIHSKPIDLLALRIDLPSLAACYKHQHSEQCFGYLHNDWNPTCPLRFMHDRFWNKETSLVKYLFEPDTFKHIKVVEKYRLYENRGDGQSILLNIQVFGSHNKPVKDRESQLVRKFRDYAYFKQFDIEVEGQIRIPKCKLRQAGNRKSFLSNPFGQDAETWAAGVVKIMIEDMGNWAKRNWWMRFWSECAVFAQSREQLGEAADEHQWDEAEVVDKQAAINEYIARHSLRFEACQATGASTRGNHEHGAF